jgi:hypothetical protein
MVARITIWFCKPLWYVINILYFYFCLLCISIFFLYVLHFEIKIFCNRLWAHTFFCWWVVLHECNYWQLLILKRLFMSRNLMVKIFNYGSFTWLSFFRPKMFIMLLMGVRLGLLLLIRMHGTRKTNEQWLLFYKQSIFFTCKIWSIVPSLLKCGHFFYCSWLVYWRKCYATSWTILQGLITVKQVYYLVH